MSNSPSKSNLFKGRHFEQEIIVLCVRWYLRYKLSYRDLVEMMAERGLAIAHTTILRWVRRYTPEFDRRWSRFSAQAGTLWRVDETYVRIRGQWAYLYRAVDSSGKTVDFRLSPCRNVASAKAFFRKAIRFQSRSLTGDTGPYAALMKSMKRVMAAEYSRDLSGKVFHAQSRFVEMGFKQGGHAGFGLRRLALKSCGTPRGYLDYGESKASLTARHRSADRTLRRGVTRKARAMALGRRADTWMASSFSQAAHRS